jgi:hypothetical protein
MKLAPRIAFLLFAAQALACAGATPESEPTLAVKGFIERMVVADRQPRALAEAYELLSDATQRGLQERARRMTDVSPIPVVAAQMISPEAWMHMVPRRYERLASTQGDSGMRVRIHGMHGEQAEVLLTWERGGWRVHLPLPPLPVLRLRTQ